VSYSLRRDTLVPVKIILLFLTLGLACRAQQETHDHRHMPGMNMGEAAPAMPAEHAASGTSVNPRSSPMDMIHKRAGAWTFMFHGIAFLTEGQQAGPRGGDKFFAPNWFMGTAAHAMGAVRSSSAR
jgi:hypothetical protein